MRPRNADLPIGIIPCFKLYFGGTGETDGSVWTYTKYRTGASLPGNTPTHVLENVSPSIYKSILANTGDLQAKLFFNFWDENATGDREYYEIFSKDEYTWPNFVTENPDQPEGVIDVELNIPYFAGGSTYNNTNYSTIIQGILNGNVQLDLYGYYNRWFTEWKITDPGDELEWSVDQFELYVHGDNYEKELISKFKFRATNETSNRETIDAAPGELVVLDKRTWHTVEVWDGSDYKNKPFWYRGTDTANTILMNYMPIREQIAHRYRGTRLYQGALVSVDPTATPAFHNTITKGSIKYLPLQGTFVAKYDEWRNITLAELTRDASGLTFEQIKEEGSEGSGYSTGGGGSAGGGGSNGGNGGGVSIPNYERATGQTGSSYTVTGFSVSAASGFSDDEINQSLYVYQDATKLSHGIGYTLSGQDLTFTYDLDSSVIEIYSWL